MFFLVGFFFLFLFLLFVATVYYGFLGLCVDAYPLFMSFVQQTLPI
jgi:hypothetical protein